MLAGQRVGSAGITEKRGIGQAIQGKVNGFISNVVYKEKDADR